MIVLLARLFDSYLRPPPSDPLCLASSIDPGPRGWKADRQALLTLVCVLIWLITERGSASSPHLNFFVLSPSQDQL